MKPFLYIAPLILSLLFSCSTTKSLKEGETLYKKGKLKVEHTYKVKQKVEIQDKLSKVVGPRPNRKFLGLKLRLWLYSSFKPKEGKKGFRYWVNKNLGEPPVLFQEDYPKRIEENLKKRANELGFFSPKVSSKTVIKRRKAKVYYFLELHQPYTIKDIQKNINENRQFEDTLHTYSFKYLKTRRFDVDKLKNCQKEVEDHMRDRGFFLYNRRALIFDADTTVGDHEVQLFVRLNNDKLPPKGTEVFFIRNVKTYVDYDSTATSIDTLMCNNNTYYKTTNKYNPAIVLDPIFNSNGEYFSNRKQRNTLLNYGYLGVFNTIRSDIDIIDTSSNELQVSYKLKSGLPKQFETRLTFSTKSNGFIGPLWENSITNKNIFKGAEKLIISFDFGFEQQLYTDADIDHIFSFTTSAEIQVPRVMAPFKVRVNPEARIPITSYRIELEYYNYAPFFESYSIGPILQYTWSDLKNRRFEFAPIDINYRNNAPARQAIDNPNFQEIEALFPNLQDRLILGSNFFISMQSKEKFERRSFAYWRTGIDLSGNIAEAIIRGTGQEGIDKKILDVPYSQYVKLESEPSLRYSISSRSQIATRLITDIGYPFGNSTELPYFKQYSLGGPYSIRAFIPRTIGPGTFIENSRDADFILHSGDIYLEYNIEYRKKITQVFEIATFIDVGNIWLLNDNPTKPGGKFTTDFYKQLAVGTGLGGRLNFDFLVVRLDMGVPMRNPVEWVIKDWDITSPEWRRKGMIFNFAIGYPF